MSGEAIHIPLVAGVKTDLDSKVVEPPFLSTAENIVCDKSGALRKRPGHSAHSTTGLTDAGNINTIIDATSRRLLVSHANAYTSKGTNTGFQKLNEHYLVDVQEYPVFRNAGLSAGYSTSNAVVAHDSAASEDYSIELCVYTVGASGGTTGTSYAIGYDASGRQLFGPTQFSAGSNSGGLRAVGVDDRVFVVGFDANDAILWSFDASGLTLTTTLRSGAVSSSPLVADICRGTGDSSSSTAAYVAYRSAADSGFRMDAITGTGTSSANAAVATLVDNIACHYRATPDRLFVAYRVGAGACTYMVRNSSTLASVLGATTVSALVGSAVENITIGNSYTTDLSSVVIAWTETGAGMRWAFATVSSVTSVQIHYGCALMSKGALDIGGDSSPVIWFLARPLGTWNGAASLFAVGVGLTDSARLFTFARVAHDIATQTTPANPPACWRRNANNDHRCLVRVTPSLVAGDGVQQVAISWNLATAARQPPRVVVGERAHICGGSLDVFDGKELVENQPHLNPAWNTNPAEFGSGAGSFNGTYSYVATYEWVDADGVVHRSGPSEAKSVTATNAQYIVMSVRNLPFSYRRGTSAITARVWRTTAGPGSVYYFASAVTFEPGAALGVTVLDAYPDATISTLETLHTTGNVLAATAPPAPSAIAVATDRMFVVNAGARNEIWYSKPHEKGVSYEFTDGQQLLADSELGSIVALAEMDGRCFVFKSRSIYVVNGTGPDATGVGAFELTRIASDVGCAYPRAIIRAPMGILFQSERGFHVLGRDLGVKDVDDVAGYLIDATLGECTAATIYQPRNEIRLFFRAASKALCWNYQTGMWSLWTLPAAPVDAAPGLWAGSANLYVEDASLSQDNNANYQVKFRTAWVKVANLQGFQRVRRVMLLGERQSTHDLALKITYDYGATDTDYSWPDATLSTLSPYQPQAHINNQKCQAIRFEYSFTAAGRGADFTAISLDVERKRGLYRQPPASKVGGT